MGFHVIKSLEQFRCDPTAPSLTIMQTARNDRCSFEFSFSILFIEDAASVVNTPAEEIALPIDKKSKKHRKELKKLAEGTMTTTTMALTTTDETETNIVDKKSMKKRVKHFLKKSKSASGTPMKPESKLSKIQKSMMGKHIQQYQSVPIIEEVRQRQIKIYLKKNFFSPSSQL